MINKDVLISANMLLNLNQQVIHFDGVIDTILVDYGVKAKTVIETLLILSTLIK